jgi:uncharacterized protein
MLRFELRALDRAPTKLSGAIPTDEAIFEDLNFELAAPVRVTGRLSSAGPGRYYWRGGIQATVQTECRRCLAAVQRNVDQEVDVLFTDEQDASDPSEYVIPERSPVLELGEAVREELILAVPEYILCRNDCAGICPQCGADLNPGACECDRPPDSRWAALEALKTTQPEDER